MSESCVHSGDCKFLQYLKDRKKRPDCKKVPGTCNRPSSKNPVGREINVETYGPQTHEEINLAVELGLMD